MEWRFRNHDLKRKAKDMESLLWVTFAILLSGVMTVLKESLQWKNKNWPPGPMKLPIIGNLHLVNKGGDPMHVNLVKLAQQHGGLMTIWFSSSLPTVVVSDKELVWEVLVTKAADFSSRAKLYTYPILSSNRQTISTSNLGSYWYSLRNGLQSTSLSPDNILQQAPSQEEAVSDMLSSLSKEATSNNGVVKPLPHLRRNTVKLIARLFFGQLFNDDIFVDGIDNTIHEFLSLAGYSGLAHVFNCARYVPGLNRPFKEMHQLRHKIEGLIRPYISRSSDNSYVQFLLSQDITEEIIIANLFEIFMLAVDSVSSTTAWSLALLIHNPKVQQKLYEEVSREVGSEAIKPVNIKNLQYLNAVVKETMRMKPIAPLAVPHRTARDSMLAGTKIAAGTNVMVNIYKLLHDPKVWVEPHRFVPDRFLASSVISNEMEKCFLPFGAGRRVCAGMELGKLQVAFTLASLVHKYKWSSAVEDQLPDLSEELTSILMMKKPLQARIAPRSSSTPK